MDEKNIAKENRIAISFDYKTHLAKKRIRLTTVFNNNKGNSTYEIPMANGLTGIMADFYRGNIKIKKNKFIPLYFEPGKDSKIYNKEFDGFDYEKYKFTNDSSNIVFDRILKYPKKAKEYFGNGHMIGIEFS